YEIDNRSKSITINVFIFKLNYLFTSWSVGGQLAANILVYVTKLNIFASYSWLYVVLLMPTFS
ncbi:MAG: hypothetical protein WBO91_03050, partial [Saprospiraceae bacterium]